jgi:hypothetical protein
MATCHALNQSSAVFSINQPSTQMTSTEKTFTFKNKDYYLERLQTAVKSGLEINVRVSDLAADFDKSIVLPKDTTDQGQTVAFYQFDGKYYVLWGMNTAVNLISSLYKTDNETLQLIPGVLITKHALKRLEVIKNPVDIAKQLAIETSHRFAARPNQSRYSANDREQRRSYTPAPLEYATEADFSNKPSRANSRDHDRNR